MNPPWVSDPDRVRDWDHAQGQSVHTHSTRDFSRASGSGICGVNGGVNAGVNAGVNDGVNDGVNAGVNAGVLTGEYAVKNRRRLSL
jgi:hypothetical protein